MGAVPRALRNVLILLAVVFVAAIAVWLLYLQGGPPTSTALPNPNGYDDFMKAAMQIVGDPSSGPTLEESALNELVSTNAEALKLLRLGLSRRCSTPTDTIFTNFSAMMADLPNLKRLGQLLMAEGRLAELQGRRVDAANIYLDAIQLGNASSHGGCLINRLVAVAVERVGHSALVKVLPTLQCSEAKALMARMQTIDANRIAWAEVMKIENRFARNEARKMHNPLNLVVSWWQGRAVKQKSKNRHDVMVAQVRLASVQLALTCYLAENGTAARQLSDVKSLQNPPIDPFTGKTLVYRPTGTNWLLYSVGVDLTDDGGRPVGRSIAGTVTKGDLFFDSPP